MSWSKGPKKQKLKEANKILHMYIYNGKVVKFSDWRWKIVILGWKIILFFYILSLDINTLDPALLQHQFSFPEVSLKGWANIHLQTSLSFFIGCEALPRNKFLQLWEQIEVWWCQIRRMEEMTEQIVQFSHPHLTLLCRCVYLIFCSWSHVSSREFWYPAGQEGWSNSPL